MRILQERTFHPLGGLQTIKADVRVITATNKNLNELVQSKTFREDLYYRINVVRLELPPLRDRKEDIPMLVNHFIDKLNKLRDKAVTGISQKALSLLMSHNYPGNIRELENIIEHAFVLCPGGQIGLRCLPDTLKISIPGPKAVHTINTALKSVEAQVILDALKRNNHNRLATAHDLGIHKSTLFRKIKALGIDLPQTDGRHQRKKIS